MTRIRSGKSSPDDRSREQQTRAQREFVLQVSRILFEADVVGLNFETNTDEYDSEAKTIVIGLPHATNAADVEVLAHETFVEWFDADTAGPRALYSDVAAAIWDAWVARGHPGAQVT